MASVYDATLSPIFEERRAELAGSLAANHAFLESQKAKAENERHNFGLVRDFVGLLPHRKSEYGELEADDAYLARQVEANSITARGPQHFGGVSTSYVVGCRPVVFPKDGPGDYSKEPPITNLLLCPAVKDAPHLKIITVYNEELQTLLDQTGPRTGLPYSERELAFMLNPGTGKLRVQPAGLTTRAKDGLHVGPYKRKHRAEMVLKKGLQLHAAPTLHFALSDEELNDFNVPASLSYLASAFRITRHYTALLATHLL